MTDEETADPEVSETLERNSRPPRGTGRFGWCIEGSHEKCPVVVQKLTCPCTCANHGTQYESLPGVSESFQKLIDRYYPPK